jgi:hypothetical protein
MENEQRTDEFVPAGEEDGVTDTFSLIDIATAFEVDPSRVHRAMIGEFGRDDVEVDSRQSQHLVEVLLGDLPMDRQTAALMKLGAYTPRADHATGLGEKDPADESDRLVRNADSDDGERG